MQWGQCGFISLADETSWAHFEAVHSAFVACDICEEMCVFLAFLNVVALYEIDIIIKLHSVLYVEGYRQKKEWIIYG